MPDGNPAQSALSSLTESSTLTDAENAGWYPGSGWQPSSSRRRCRRRLQGIGLRREAYESYSWMSPPRTTRPRGVGPNAGTVDVGGHDDALNG